MNGDFSRSTFDVQKHYRSVRMQQGRVLLDSDWNAQSDLLHHQLETSLGDAVGRLGLPEQITQVFGFQIDIEHAPPLGHPDPEGHHPRVPDFSFLPGHAYVDGILCENEGIKDDQGHVRSMRFSEQPDFPGARDWYSSSERADAYIVYIDAWSRPVTALQDPDMVEPALGGVDTTVREKNICQIKLWPVHHRHEHPHQEAEQATGSEPRGWDMLADEHPDLATLRNWERFRREHTPRGQMSIAKPVHGWTLGNQLYRVEIHHGDDNGSRATLKWSRENGSVAFRVSRVEMLQAVTTGGPGTQPATDPVDTSTLVAAPARFTLYLGGLARAREGFATGNLVELADDEAVLNGKAWPLCRVLAVHPEQETIDIEVTSNAMVKHLDKWARLLPATHPFIRRWDHLYSSALEDGAIPFEPDRPLDLENGLRVEFHGHGYLAGDYWMISTRTAEGPCWPHDPSGDFSRRLPDGLTHHYAPIALLFHHKHEWQVRQRDVSFLPLTTLTTRVKHTEEELAKTRRDLEKEIEETREALEKEIDATREELEEKITRSHRELENEIHVIAGELRATQVSLAQVLDILHRWGAGPRRARVLEYFVSPHHLQVGDVVALIPGEIDCVQRCSRQNSSQVVGVVVGEPIRLSETGEVEESEPTSVQVSQKTSPEALTGETHESAFRERRYPVATCGNARCKVVGPVDPGDLLTASRTPGCARRVPFFPWPGTVIGKALQGHEGRDIKHKDSIEVLVTLS